jgi:hypothetical protein
MKTAQQLCFALLLFGMFAFCFGGQWGQNVTPDKPAQGGCEELSSLEYKEWANPIRANACRINVLPGEVVNNIVCVKLILAIIVRFPIRWMSPDHQSAIGRVTSFYRVTGLLNLISWCRSYRI